LVADALFKLGLYQDALTFYQPLKRIAEHATASLYTQIGICFQGSQLILNAEESYQMAIHIDENTVQARVELAKMYEDLGERAQALFYLTDAWLILRSVNPRSLDPSKSHQKRSTIDGPLPLLRSHKEEAAAISIKAPWRYKPRVLDNPAEKQKEENVRAKQLQSQYHIICSGRRRMRDGDVRSTSSWMEAARDLTDDFRSCKTFYSWDKYVKFLGYTGDSRTQAETPLDRDLTARIKRLSQSMSFLCSHFEILLISLGLRASPTDKSSMSDSNIPADYRHISFSAWLDIFVEYALCLARSGRIQESYEICEAAKDAVVFCQSREDLFLIHVTWCSKSCFVPSKLQTNINLKLALFYLAMKKLVLLLLGLSCENISLPRTPTGCSQQ
jgi:general transcription factor 3C polypeptide 3 (transcription factor C subunit 4)